MGIDIKLLTLFSGEITWTCHICKRERPDALISVYKKPLIIQGRLVGEQNIRYCKDNPACLDGAKQFSFIKDS